MRVVANDTGFDTDADTNLLTALARHGVCARFSCRNGNCGLCEADLNSGSVWLDDTRTQVCAPARILLCRAFARSDIALSVPQTQPVLSRYCEVLSVDRAGEWCRVQLQLPAGRAPVLHLGQMLRLDQDVRSRRITITVLPTKNAPRVLEVWINAHDAPWQEALTRGTHLRIQLPLGEAFVSSTGLVRVLVDHRSWDRAQALWLHLQSQTGTTCEFIAVDHSVPPPWFGARTHLVDTVDASHAAQLISLLELD